MKNPNEVDKLNDAVPASVKVLIVLLGAFSLLFVAGSHIFYWMWRNKVLFVGDGEVFGEEKWGQYGDFIGGVTNPIISLLTFCGLLYTILVQRRELSLQTRELSNSSQALKATEEELRQTKEIAANQAEFYKRESKKTDIEKAMEQIKLEIDAALSWRKDDRHLTVREVIGNEIAKYTEDYTKDVEASGEYGKLIYGVISDLQSLSYFIDLYTEIERRSALVAFYNIKYIELVREIVRSGFIDAEKFSGLISAMPPLRK